MNAIRGIGLVIILLSLLSWLYFLGSDPGSARYDKAIVTLDQFRMAESTLRQKTVDARAGLLRSYDSIDFQLATIRRLLDRLHQEGLENDILSPLKALVAQQEELTEHFKTDNALLQNSLAYFGLLTGRFGFTIESSPLDADVAALAASMIHLILDTSAASAADVQDALDHLAALPSSAVDADLRVGLLVHGRALHDLLPVTDDMLRSLYDLPVVEEAEALRMTVIARRQQVQMRARRYRELLYAVSILLIILIVALGLQLRRSMTALRRRAAFEHMIAGISIGFVNASTEELRAVIEHALGELAKWLAADRAYLIVSSASPQLYLWSETEALWPVGWPYEAPAAARSISGNADTADTLVYVPSIESLKPGQARSALAEAGIRGWAFICGDGQTETRYSLGFEALNQAMTWPADQIGLLRMAVNTFAGAVGRARLEGERARLQTSLEGARRMETVGALTSGIAHNFNNIIGAILGHTEMLETEYAAESRLARHVAGIRLAAERARDLVEELLNFGRQRVAPQQQISLRTLVSETQSLLAASLPRNVQLSVGEASVAAIVRGNPTQLQQVVINLCNNAAQAMGYAGRVELTINMRTVVAPAQLSHGHLSPGSYVRIAVRDRGRGIDDATLAHLFEPFFTTRAEGTGLGLATVREIVGNHGGALNVTSQLNEGSFFEVWLPAVVSETSADALDYPPVGGKGETVLILNEDKDRILHDEELVAALGYEPVGFTDAATALTATRTNPDRFDLFLIARIEPVSEALSVARKLHSVSAQLPILMVTPTEALGAQVLAQAGVREVIGAPLTSCDLALALQRHLSSVRSDQHA